VTNFIAHISNWKAKSWNMDSQDIQMHSGNSDPLHSVHPSPISPPAPRKKADVTRIAQFNSNFMNSPQPIQPQSFAQRAFSPIPVRTRQK
jgi:hypothetical protein